MQEHLPLIAKRSEAAVLRNWSDILHSEQPESSQTDSLQPFGARRPQRFGRKCPVLVGWGAVDSNFTWFAAEWLGMDFECVAVDCMKMIMGGMMENETMCGIVCCFLNTVTSTKCVAWLRRMTGKAGNLALFFLGSLLTSSYVTLSDCSALWVSLGWFDDGLFSHSFFWFRLVHGCWEMSHAVLT